MIYARLDEAIEDLDTRLGGLPHPAEAEDIWDELWHQEAHHSTALEGNTLILDQVRKLLDEGRAVGSKERREYTEVKGYADAARWVYGEGVEPGDWTSGDLLSLQEVRSVHRQAMTPVWDVSPHPHATPKESPASWREHGIAPFPGGMKPPPFPGFAHLMLDSVHLQERTHQVPERHAQSGCRRPRPDGGAHRPLRHEQPLPVRHTRRRRPSPAGATGRPGRQEVRSDRQRAPRGRIRSHPLWHTWARDRRSWHP